MAKMKRKDRIEWLEKQIEVQEDALVHCPEREMYIHGALLERLTEEWVELMRKENK